jgi:peptidoglycan hydrolase-like protein with peptidoglycan-binding domain
MDESRRRHRRATPDCTRHRVVDQPRPRLRRGHLLVALACLAAIVTIPGVDASPRVATGRATVPAAVSGLPGDVEPLSPYLKQTSCDPVDKPGALAWGNLLRATYPGTSYSIGRGCGADGMASEHYEGRAVDWFVSTRDAAGAARADAVLTWLLAPDTAGHVAANARRLGIMYVIWNNRIWGSYAADAGWRAYSVCASHPETSWDTSCHRDHIHFSLSWAGAMRRTSYWTRSVAAVDYGPCRPADLSWAPPYAGPRAAPCPTFPAVTPPVGSASLTWTLARFSGATVGPGQSGPVVSAVQQALGSGADGAYGPSTTAAVQAFQRAHALSPSGRMDAGTWRALLHTHGVDASTGAVAPTGGTTQVAELRRNVAVVLSVGATGAAVAAVQRSLHLSPADGSFGPVTKAAVLTFQQAHGIPTTGSVGPLTWAALIKAASVGAPTPASGSTGLASGAGKGAVTATSLLTTRLSVGSRGPAVVALQRALHLSPADGVFGAGTRRAVLTFQLSHGLPVTGIVAMLTWAALTR